MAMAAKGAEIDRSALIIVDMQNDFLHREGSFGHIAREHPEFHIDMPFLLGTIYSVKRLADAFRAAERPVVYLADVLKRDYSDASFPYWRIGIEPASGNRTHCVEGTFAAKDIRASTRSKEAATRPSPVHRSGPPAQMTGGLAPGARLGSDRRWRGVCVTRTIGGVDPPLSGADDERPHDP